METEVKKQVEAEEYWFREGCFITEIANDANDPGCSIARARVLPGTRTAWHELDGIVERYLITAGSGMVEIGDSLCCAVATGDVIRIPENTRQRIRNNGRVDLIFYAICTPAFTSDSYIALEDLGAEDRGV